MRSPLATSWFRTRLASASSSSSKSRLAAELAAGRQWDEDGFNGAYDWIRINCHVPANVAGDYLTVGAHLPQLAQSVQAMLAGEIGFAHLAVMARTAQAVGKAFDETKLLPLAKDNSAGKFFYKSLHYRHSASSKKYAEEQAEQAETNFLHMNRGEDGSFFLVGSLDPVGGAVVRSALEPLARLSGARDHRLRPQRMADALIELAGHKTKIQMQVTSSVQTLLDLTGAPGAETEFSLPISSKTVERWACDCSLTRVLMQDSVVIDVGRAERRSEDPSGGRSMPVTSIVNGRAASALPRGATDITSSTGCTAVATNWKTSSSYAPDTTGRCMRAAGS